jgi:hypothetical protein
MNVRLNYLVLLYIVLSFYILHISSSIKNKIVLLSLCMIIPLYIILFFAQSNKFLYLYSVIGMITFITVQLLIFLFTNRIVKKIK